MLDFLQEVLKVEDVKTKLWCETSFKFWKFKLRKVSLNWQFQCAADPSIIPVQTSVFRNRPPDKLPHASSEARFVLQNTEFRSSANSQNAFRGSLPSKSESENEALVRDFPQILAVEDVKTKLSCETSLKKWKLKMWKRSFRARLPFQHSVIQFNSIQFNSIQFNSVQLRSFQFNSFLHSFSLGRINIRNAEVPSNFLWLFFGFFWIFLPSIS